MYKYWIKKIGIRSNEVKCFTAVALNESDAMSAFTDEKGYYGEVVNLTQMGELPLRYKRRFKKKRFDELTPNEMNNVVIESKLEKRKLAKKSLWFRLKTWWKEFRKFALRRV